MDELVDEISEKVGIDADAARAAVGTMLALVKSDGNPELVDQMLSVLPDADDLAGAHPLKKKGGIMGAIGNAVGGNSMAAYGMLTSAGLKDDQIKDIAEIVFDYAKDRAGEELVAEVVSSVPGLSTFM